MINEGLMASPSFHYPHSLWFENTMVIKLNLQVSLKLELQRRAA